MIEDGGLFRTSEQEITLLSLNTLLFLTPIYQRFQFSLQANFPWQMTYTMHFLVFQLVIITKTNLLSLGRKKIHLDSNAPGFHRESSIFTNIKG